MGGKCRRPLFRSVRRGQSHFRRPPLRGGARENWDSPPPDAPNSAPADHATHLVCSPGIRYNAGFLKEDGADMANGIVDIPLPGQPLWADQEDGGDAAHCHFLAGPENHLVEVAVRSVVDQPPNGYNPLVLFGPSGTGKSHLARGLAAVFEAPQSPASHGLHDRCGFRPRTSRSHRDAGR